MENQGNIGELIRAGNLKNPHAFLGLQHKPSGEMLIRLWRPNQTSCSLEVKGQKIDATQVDSSGLFECSLKEPIAPQEYKVYDGMGKVVYDPYDFPETIGDLDRHLIARGLHYQLYDLLGATLITHQGVTGVNFAVWAPNARSVCIMGPFNNWNNTAYPMRFVEGTGVWGLFIPGIEVGECYLFVVYTQQGEELVKVDPVSHYFEVRPNQASRVFHLDGYQWEDVHWMETRGKFRGGPNPIQIYEVHLGSWKRREGRFLGYRELAHDLAAYCTKMHFTHVELVGISEHPLDESWGYQVTGYFAPTSRHGTPEDFRYFVDYLHQRGIGVILDWVPGHFPTDQHSLIAFDGTYLYEHMDPRQGYQPAWETHIFNYGRWEVSNFLIASALFWLERMHIDGLRVDAVASMLFLDYAKKEGEWIPNKEGTNINLEAVEFLKHLNSIIHQMYPQVLTIAEESHGFQGVTTSVESGGLGFDYKWNLGWMNDTLRFMTKPFGERRKYFASLVQPFTFQFNDAQIYVLSHDEVVHLKKSLLSKMPGTKEEKFAGVRLLLSFMSALPGKTLLFMGGEFGQETEWDCLNALPWHLLGGELNQKLQSMVSSLNELVSKTLPLFWGDTVSSTFAMANEPDSNRFVLSFFRKSVARTVLCIHSFGNESTADYFFHVPGIKRARLLFNSDWVEWGGSGRILKEKVEGGRGLCLNLPPLTTLMFEVDIVGEKKG